MALPQKSKPDFSLSSRGASEFAFSPDGKVLAARKKAQIQKQKDADRINPVRLPTFSLTAGDRAIERLVFSPDGKTLATGDDRVVRYWDCAKRDHWGAIDSSGGLIAFSPSGFRMVASDSKGLLHFWYTRSGRRDLPIPRPFVQRHIVFSPDGSTLAIANLDNVVQFLDAHSGEMLALEKTFPGVDTNDLYLVGKSFSFTRGRSFVWISRGSQGIVHRYDQVKQKVISTKLQEVKGYPDVNTKHGGSDLSEFAPNGKQYLRGCAGDNRICVWDSETGKATLLPELSARIGYATFSADGDLLAFASVKGVIEVWQLSTNKRMAVLQVDIQKSQIKEREHQHPPGVKSLAFSPDGRLLAAGLDTGRIALFEVSGGAPVLDEKLFEGVWDALAIEFDGAITTAADLRRPGRYQIPPRNLFGEAEAKPAEMGILRWTITGDKITLGEKKRTFSFKLNSTATPKQIDLLAVDGPDKGKTVQGIYRFDDDRLCVCLPKSSDPQNFRPKSFKTKPGTGLLMVTLEPAKKGLAPRKDGSPEKKIQDASPTEKKKKKQAETLSPDESPKGPDKKTLTAGQTVWAMKLLADLESSKFLVSEEAMRELAAFGPPVVPLLIQHRVNPPSLETACRIERILGKIEATSSSSQPVEPPSKDGVPQTIPKNIVKEWTAAGAEVTASFAACARCGRFYCYRHGRARMNGVSTCIDCYDRKRPAFFGSGLLLLAAGVFGGIAAFLIPLDGEHRRVFLGIFLPMAVLFIVSGAGFLWWSWRTYP